jgi:hypothetical protein
VSVAAADVRALLDAVGAANPAADGHRGRRQKEVMSIAAAIRVAAKAAEKTGGQTVTIQRGNQTIQDVPCGLGSSSFQTIGADGAVVTIRSRDFLIRRELYDFGDGPVTPARGDLAIFTEGDGDHTYELLDLPSEPSWRWSDPYQQRLRLHTKEIAKPA